MKKFVLFGLIVLSSVLAACSQSSEAELSSQRYRGAFTLVTDIPSLVEPLSHVADVRYVESAKLAKAAAFYNAGVVSYTPDPGRIYDWKPVKVPLVSRYCQLVLCDKDGNPVPDPRLDGITAAIDFAAVYATPVLLERAAKLGYSAKTVSAMDAGTLVKLITETGFNVAGVSKTGVSRTIPGSPSDDWCRQQPVPKICWYISALDRLDVERFDVSSLDKHIQNVGLVIIDYRDLTQLEHAGELIQLHGEGIEPLVSTLRVAIPARASDLTMKNALGGVYGDEAQYSLAKAGFVPASGDVYDRVIDEDISAHVESALKYGQLNTP